MINDDCEERSLIDGIHYNKEKPESIVFVMSDSKELAFLSRAMAILTGREKQFCLLCGRYNVSTLLEYEERIKAIC